MKGLRALAVREEKEGTALRLAGTHWAAAVRYLSATQHWERIAQSLVGQPEETEALERAESCAREATAELTHHSDYLANLREAARRKRK